MSNEAEYLRRAEEAEAAARTLSGPLREGMLKVAEDWRRLAQQAAAYRLRHQTKG